MSNRFYVNDVQIFGNNEMFDNTYEELKRQGAEWTEDCTFDCINISDPQALMNAVTKDTAEYLKKVNCDYFDEESMEDVHKDFSELKDSDLLNVKGRFLLHCLYGDNGEYREQAWKLFGWYLDEIRIFTPYNLYNAIRNCVEDVGGKLVLKEGCEITACMY